ncbi:hypothetical protein HRR83_004930 [Exophiala dermatitidis]|uniref:Cytomegalovirus gH-receptor family protein n=2 Tax=Exophiala dermatitidis TaxID=5970 RepID=H6C3J5_EXODN|nr:uncharacterized protein HMPREF1120_06222 [Exophiala dermatitidis NIH/UT8656]KAJ4517155.1 hypothetical protein HRR74_004905 [Exophiala dermatitidis]EHY58210.1 hypothetical protein HMPREF1120_06222 [Exophiala dermatitidis NIH/UT8656]KAJ4519667.1 hypothetical protein HRR73_003727 [Exophiala dermatitidis]KAJ4534533.1 hypothetical protein HRR76_006455 [Exophiala dermatitidis]KAJ4541520.1 hypothetical protein HRR78_007404 [Exophiala dermatitidis]
MDGPTGAATRESDHLDTSREPLIPLDLQRLPGSRIPQSTRPEESAKDDTKSIKGYPLPVVPNGTSPAEARPGLQEAEVVRPSYNGPNDRDGVDRNTRPRAMVDNESAVGSHHRLDTVLKNNTAIQNGTLNGQSLTPSPSGEATPVDESFIQEPGKVPRLSADELQELMSSPASLAIRPLEKTRSQRSISDSIKATVAGSLDGRATGPVSGDAFASRSPKDAAEPGKAQDGEKQRPRNLTIEVSEHNMRPLVSPRVRPGVPQRALSTPTSLKSPMSPARPDRVRPSLKVPDPLRKDNVDGRRYSSSGRPLPSPMPPSIPLPPMSLPTYLQLELSSQRPSPLYVHRSSYSEFPYESSSAKIERLVNFLLLPPHLESVLWFGMLTCLDSWLYTFTILPLRLMKSFYLLAKSWVINGIKEMRFVSTFVYNGAGRMWERRRRRSSVQRDSSGTSSNQVPEESQGQNAPARSRKQGKYHQRSKSIPSTLLPDDKADILKGLLIISTCLILLKLDASRMYHWIRGQAAIKLYVIYNLLEVCDRLLSAIGQDVLECLFSREALERKPDGHSKVLRPFWLFILALIYTVAHSTALFYQVITLNVAVNSYSNALITLLLSNQFVEIKSTVFKKFEKENLFQLTCADIVERFQLWHMLIIIASRNIVETGGLSAGLNALTGSSSLSTAATLVSNSSVPLTSALPPKSSSSILPRSFTLVPAVVNSIASFAPAASQVLGPFLAVLGSEMLVDWIKHAYINKFNNTRPAIYDRFLDVLAKDYYTNAFGDQNLTKRLGLPVIPLSCLLIRASVQTYQMFKAAWVPSTSPTSFNSLASIHEHYSMARSNMPVTTGAAISRTVDDIIKAIPAVITRSRIVTHLTTVLVCLLIFLILLACKLVLGMMLLAFSRYRYHSMKLREKDPNHRVEGGRRVGGWGVVEVDEDKQRWIYEDDPAGLRSLREREEREKAKQQQKNKEKGEAADGLDKVKRYDMVAKRIW